MQKIFIPAEIRLLIQKQVIVEYRHLTNAIYPTWKRSDAEVCFISPEMSNGSRGWVFLEKPTYCSLLTYSSRAAEEVIVYRGFIYTVRDILCEKGYL
jgi:hypothetical protein